MKLVDEASADTLEAVIVTGMGVRQRRAPLGPTCRQLSYSDRATGLGL